MNVSGDNVRFEGDVGTNMGRISSEREFWILDNDGEPMVMGVQWYNDLVGIIVVRWFESSILTLLDKSLLTL